MLYPPILASAKPVFSIDNRSFDILFTLATITSPDEISTIQLLVAQQSNNKSIINTTSGIKKDIPFSQDSLKVTITPSNDFVLSRWKAGSLYKVQLRFADSSGNVSEWSTVMIIKPIKPPTLTIEKEKNILSTSSTELVSSLTPTFFGYCTMPTENKEVEDFYRFCIYEGETLIEDAGWKEHYSGQEDIGYFLSVLENQHEYSITYQIRTHNGYEQQAGPIDFIAIQSTTGDLDGITILATPDVENACISFSLQSAGELNGNFVITRTSEESNYKRFEDIYFLHYAFQSVPDMTIVFQDFTIESGIDYQYALQQVNKNLTRSNALLTTKNTVDYEYSYLYHDNVQLRLKLNNKISSFKHSTLRSKQDTLGDKYPHLLQNGNAYYAEFPISGTISYQDNTETFFTTAVDGVYYNGELILKKSKFEKRADGLHQYDSPLSHSQTFNHKTAYSFNAGMEDYYAYSDDKVATEDRRSTIPFPNNENSSPSSQNTAIVDYSISTDLTDNNIFIERKFREKVEEFLNNFDYKLFKSPTEGTIVVSLMNISMTPNETLGRIIYDFSATAYEVLDCTLSEMNTYGIINIGEIIDLSEIAPSAYSFGQLIYRPSENTNIFNRISAIESVNVGELYQYNLDTIDKIWIEPYPIASLEKELDELEIGTDEAKVVQQYINISGKIPTIFSFNGQRIIIPQSKIYTLAQSLDSINVISCYYPVVINYACHLSLEEKQDIHIIQSVATSLKMGQLAQIFEQDTDVLAAIKAYAKENIGVEVTELQDGTWQDNNGNQYIFSGLNSLDIEGDIGTIFEIGDSDSDYTTYKIGYNNLDDKIRFESTRIFFPDVISHANYIHLPNAVYMIINFTYYLETRIYSTES